MFTYQHTHVSKEDGSPAMLVFTEGDLFVLVNEDGFAWADDAELWKEI